MIDDDTFYHKVTLTDCVSVADKDEMTKLTHITAMDLLIDLANRWCDINGYRLGGYLGQDRWDATKLNKEGHDRENSYS